MTYVTVTCHHCKAKYSLFFITGKEELGICPHCAAPFPRKPYGKLYDAMRTVEEVNKDLRVAHEERGEPLFQVEMRNRYVPTNKVMIAD